MSNTIRCKADVQTSYHNGTRDMPMLNVKVYATPETVKLPLCLGGVAAGPGEPIVWHYTDEGFTHEWIDALPDDVRADFWQMACEIGWERAKEDADDILGTSVKVWGEGRSGGWLVVDGLPDVEGWDAIALGKWRKFARYVDALVSDVPHTYCDLIYANVYEPEQEEAAEDEYRRTVYLMGSVF